MRLEKWDFKRSFIASRHDFNVHVFGHKREDIASVRSHRDSLQTVNVLFFLYVKTFCSTQNLRS